MPRLHRTLGADETKGKFLWFEGDNWIFGVLAALLGVFIMAQVQRYPWHFAVKMGATLLPLVLVSLWCVLLRQGKPPSNDVDLLEDILDTEKIWFHQPKDISHPLGLDSDIEEEEAK